MKNRVLLCIMDGWGLAHGNDSTNAVKLAIIISSDIRWTMDCNHRNEV